ncbi:Fe3+-hydroxamate ABC transporter permease FhuB [Rhodovibrio salinarum]|uniref:Fe3+-hydroxamate ABC transporter permease FhuB n=1 Tax=Rhodovibrio salinarum TaxID=1087 RepID=A0A934V348_9PROT|nr:Fe(3+)-hydroxamate ABC transporter permease FhuB [Rhodovibrio salinarum]MBK1699104.1 Fe3+-hydroxamate ABC transporter permease FhuB [Rhodovibrio salinarum]
MSPAQLLLALVVPALGLLLAGLAQHVALDRLADVAVAPDPTRFADVFVHHALLPRAVVAVLVGVALGLSGTVFQQVLRNPLAEPSTLGILSGAQLGVTIGALVTPGLFLGVTRDLAAFCGAAGAMALVFAIAWRRSLSPITLILAGLIISLVAGSATALLGIFQYEFLRSVFIWSSGSLLQNDWGQAQALAWRLALGILLLVPLLRPLTVAGLDDTSATSLGVPLRRVRLLALAVATALAAAVASAVGVVGFIGLAAPHLARVAGARTFRARLVWAPLLGAALLLLADGVVQLAARWIAQVPTGIATAMLGAPLLLVLIKSMPLADTADQLVGTAARRLRIPRLALGLTAVGLTIVVALSLSEHVQVGQLPLMELIGGRWPRVLASLTAGGMLALAGTIVQRTTGNALASPEVLGVSSGAALGVIAALFLGAGMSPVTQLVAATLGALLVFPLLLLLARSVRFAPNHVLLCGVALGTLFTSVVSLVVASGDPRASYVLVWITGPTFRAGALPALAGALLLALGLGLSLLTVRWLGLLPLGATTSQALGVRVGRSRLLLLSISAVLTAGATLLTGPLTFVGLMAPHMARMAGFVRARHQLLAAMLIGAAIMVAADWLGRSLHFPYEIPAGILATFVGAPYFLWLLARRG